MKSHNRCFVYLIAANSGGLDGPVKVGISQNVVGRLRTLQTASPYKLRLIHQFEFPDSEIAGYMEESFHAMESDTRLHGEWFSLNPTVALQRLCFCIEWLFAEQLGERNPEYIEISHRLSGLNQAKEKLIFLGVE